MTINDSTPEAIKQSALACSFRTESLGNTEKNTVLFQHDAISPCSAGLISTAYQPWYNVFLTTKQRQPAYQPQKRSAEQSIIESVTNNMFCFTVYMNQIGDWTVGTAVSLSQLDAQFRMPNAL
jgi:hypothetical protein